MAKYYKRKTKDDDLWKPIEAFLLLYVLYLIFLWFSDKGNFWRWVVYGLIVLILITAGLVLYRTIQIKIKEKRIKRIINTIKTANLEKYINDFISNYGLGKQEKAENSWNYRDYSIAWYRINDLNKFLKEKNIIFSNREICFLLKEYIEKREYKKMLETSETSIHYFKDLNGAGFERLLYRLYEAMGYTIQLTGKVGDQGGDLVIIKGGKRIIVQAKRYQDLVNNKAIQEAVAAKSIYNCDSSTVVTTSDFTSGARELAKANNVYLINGKKLKELILYNLKENWI